MGREPSEDPPGAAAVVGAGRVVRLRGGGRARAGRSAARGYPHCAGFCEWDAWAGVFAGGEPLAVDAGGEMVPWRWRQVRGARVGWRHRGRGWHLEIVYVSGGGSVSVEPLGPFHCVGGCFFFFRTGVVAGFRARLRESVLLFFSVGFKYLFSFS